MRSQSGQFFKQRRALVVIKNLRATDQGLGLFMDGRNHGWVRMTEIGRALSTNTVNIFASVGIPQMRALAANNDNLSLGVNTAGMSGLSINNRLCVHIPTTVPSPAKAARIGCGLRESARITRRAP